MSKNITVRNGALASQHVRTSEVGECAESLSMDGSGTSISQVEANYLAQETLLLRKTSVLSNAAIRES